MLLVSYKDIKINNKKNIFSFYLNAIKYRVTNHLFPIFIITGLIKFILKIGIIKFFGFMLKNQIINF